MLLFINITPAVEPRYLTDAEQIKAESETGVMLLAYSNYICRKCFLQISYGDLNIISSIADMSFLRGNYR